MSIAWLTVLIVLGLFNGFESIRVQDWLLIPIFFFGSDTFVIGYTLFRQNTNKFVSLFNEKLKDLEERK